MTVGEKFISDGHLFDAYNHTDHAAKLVEEVKYALKRDDFANAQKLYLESAERANERAQYAIADAKRRLADVLSQTSAEHKTA